MSANSSNFRDREDFCCTANSQKKIYMRRRDVQPAVILKDHPWHKIVENSGASWKSRPR
jgi:hypothetical protein